MSIITTTIIFFVFLSLVIAQNQTDDVICNGFRITSPMISHLHWTAGQCYQVSYDLGTKTTGGEEITVSVDLFNSKNQKVSNLVKNEPVNASGGTNPFNLNANATGIYHYSVILSHNHVECEPQKSVDFEIILNLNSAPVKC